MKTKLFPLLMFWLLSFSFAYAQVVTVSPEFPTQSDVITITFDASQGNAALSAVTPIYAHIGYNDWKGAPTWLDNTAKYKLTDIGNNKHTLTITPNTFFGITNTTVITQLSMVFRNALGTKVGKTATDGDIFIPIYTAGAYSAKISNPTTAKLYALNEAIAVSATASAASTIQLYVNNNIVAEKTGATSLTYNLTLSNAGNTLIKMVSTNGDTTITETKKLVVLGTVQSVNPTENVVDGINYINNTTVILQLHAPSKTFIYAVGDFSNWEYDADYFMKKRADNSSKWWVKISNLTPEQLYRFQYWIGTEQDRFADPYTELALNPWDDQWINYSYNVYPNLPEYPSQTTGIVATFQTAKPAYDWKYSTNFVKPARQHLVIYELLIRDFVKEHSYDKVMAKLDYLQNLGISAIQLMPVMEYNGNESWGYGTDFFFAPDKYYGSANALKLFIDEAHKRGMAVILDVVFNHSTGNNPMVGMYWDGVNNKPTADNPWFFTAGQHPFNVFEDFDHDRPLVQEFIKRVCKFWIQEYKFDGYRFDLAKGFTNEGDNWWKYDQDRINILKGYADAMRSVDPNAYVILEYFADNSEEKVMSDYECMPWGNMNKEFGQASMGYTTEQDLSWMDYKNRGYFHAGLVGYAESHDEERIMYKNLAYGASSGSYNIKDTVTALKRIELMMHFLIPQTGPKMIWQFGELGYDIGIETGGKTSNKPIKWEYMNNPNRAHLYKVTAALAKLKRDQAAFRGYDYYYNTSGQGKILKINHSDYNVVIIGNFATTSMTITPGFQANGTWYEYWTGTSINVTNAAGHQITLAPGEYKLYTSKQLTAPDLATSLIGPTAAFTPSKTTICKGESVTFTDNSTNAPTTWVWNIGNGDVLTEQNPIYTFASSGTYTITLTASNAFGTSTKTSTITVADAPTLTMSANASICAGESTTLTATSSTNTLIWSSGQATASITVSPTTTTTYTVTAGSGTCAVTDKVVVSVTTKPTINAGTDVTICSGNATTLTATGGSNYVWSTSATTASISVTPTTTTTYSVTAGSNNCTASDQVIVNVTATPNADAGGDVTICTGGTIQLTATGGTTFAWSNAQATASITVSPSSTTTYTVTVSNGSCSATDKVVVTIGSVLTPGIAGDLSICLGESTTLTASGGVMYLWSTNASTPAITVSPTTNTTYTVGATNAGCSGSNAVVVVVNTPPTANAGIDKTICLGANTTLSASGGLQYLWNTGSTTSSTTVTPMSTTTYTVTVTDNKSCSNTDNITVSVSQVIADAGIDKSACSGETVSITATGGTSYLWNNSANTATITPTVTNTTTYTVTVTNANSCTGTDQVVVTKTGSKPVASFTPTITGYQVSFDNTSVGATSNSWKFGDGTTSSEIDPSHTYTNGGAITVTLTVTNSCGTDSVKTILANVSYNEMVKIENNVTLYPNPTQGIFIISSSFNQLDLVQIYDITGRMIIEEHDVQKLSSFDLTTYEAGIYFVKIEADNKSVTIKLINQ